MGTNYYVARNYCSCCDRYDREWHIGKSSVGWVFSFQGYKLDRLTSWKEWKEFLRNEIIVDEYGEQIEYDRFVELIEVYKSPAYTRENGRTNLQHNVESRRTGDFNPKYDWDCADGYPFSNQDFS